MTTTQLKLMRGHFEMMAEANRIMNLTRISEFREAAVKHYADSLALLPWTEHSSASTDSILDIGTGAGFPSVPIAIMRPNWSILAIDGTSKKVEFVARCAGGLALKNLCIEHAHSDHWPSAQQFDLVVTRALAPLAKCMRAARSRMKKDARLVAYKSSILTPEEMAEATAMCRELGMAFEAPFEYELHWNGEVLSRKLYVVRRAS